MRVRTALDFMFSAAVRLPNELGAAKRMHGHNYRLQITLDGEPDEAAVRKVVRDVALEPTDHRTLNDVVPNPTPANVAKWFFEKLQPKLTGLVEVALWPTAEHCVRVSASL